mgnify:CR=1 FL=1
MSELYARHNFVNSSTLLVHRLNLSALKCFYNNKCAAKLRLRIIKHCSYIKDCSYIIFKNLSYIAKKPCIKLLAFAKSAASGWLAAAAQRASLSGLGLCGLPAGILRIMQSAPGQSHRG